MRGLLFSRLARGPSGAEKLSKSLFRHSKLRKRSKRPPLRRAKTLVQTISLATETSADTGEPSHPSAEDTFYAVADQEEGTPVAVIEEDVDTQPLLGGPMDDHAVAAVNTGNGLKEGQEFHVTSIHQSDEDDDSFDVLNVDENVTEIEGSAVKSLLSSSSEEEDEEGREDSLLATPHAFDNGCKHSTGGSASLDEHENNHHFQEEVVSDPPKGPLILPDWEAVMSIIAEIPTAITFICGGKNTGKSTFARYLINSLLNRYEKVGFLDTDVGQPEFTPSGCLSLHLLDKPIIGLPALEMKYPEKCYFFGDISPKSNPEDYLNSVYSLYNHFNNKVTMSRSESKSSMLENGGFQLIVNTHGWIQGVGLDVLIKMIRYIVPTHIVQIVSRMSTRNLPLNRFWELSTDTPSKAQLLYINAALGDNMHLAEIKYDARELRDLRLLSYFHRSLIDQFMLTTRLSSLFEKAASAMACCKPFQVPISSIHVLQQHFQVPASEVIYSLNATLVGLGVSTENEQDIKPWCVGLGIVRAVDPSRGLLYVITPLRLDAVQKVNTFLQGRIEIPVSFLKAPRYVSPYLCKNTITMEGTGSAAMGKGKKKVLRMLRSPGAW